MSETSDAEKEATDAAGGDPYMISDAEPEDDIVHAVLQETLEPCASSSASAETQYVAPTAKSRARMVRAKKRASPNWEHIHAHELEQHAQKRRRRDARRMAEAMGQEITTSFSTRQEVEKVNPLRGWRISCSAYTTKKISVYIIL